MTKQVDTPEIMVTITGPASNDRNRVHKVLNYMALSGDDWDGTPPNFRVVCVEMDNEREALVQGLKEIAKRHQFAATRVGSPGSPIRQEAEYFVDVLNKAINEIRFLAGGVA